MHNIPRQTQSNEIFILSCIWTINIFFFTVIHPRINHLDYRIGRHAKGLTHDERIFKPIFLNGLLGVSVAILNTVLSKMMEYPLRKEVILTLSIASIMFHLSWNKMKQYSLPKKQATQSNIPQI